MISKKENPNYYAIIPANVRYNNELSANAKLIFGEITCLTNKTGECWASNSYFARLYKKSQRQISRYIDELKEQGYIEVNIFFESENKSKRIIKLIEYRQECKGGIDKDVLGGIDKDVQHNNTSINITSIILDEAEIFGNKTKTNIYKSTEYLINQWNEFADKHNLEKVSGSTPIRMRNIKARIKEDFDFDKILKKVEQSDFWLHQFRDGQGMFFDYLIKNKDGYTKILEQNENKKFSNADKLKQLIERKNKLMKGINNGT